MLARNERIYMTRRYPDLPNKVLKRDSDIVKRITKAWDEEKDPDKVFKIFINEKGKLSDERYWEVMRSVWILCGSLQNVGIFKHLMKSTRRSKHYFSTPEESEKLRNLPEEFEVFRAADDEQDGGISWTLNRAYAAHYGYMYNKKHVYTKNVSKKEVFAFIERNDESEIIIL